jgi:plasmid maintenance system killer protein
MMSEENDFELSGFVHIQNMRLLSEANPYELQLEPLHSQRSIGVWCQWSLFFEDESGSAVIVTADPYLPIANEFLSS